MYVSISYKREKIKIYIDIRMPKKTLDLKNIPDPIIEHKVDTIYNKDPPIRTNIFLKIHLSMKKIQVQKRSRQSSINDLFSCVVPLI